MKYSNNMIINTGTISGGVVQRTGWESADAKGASPEDGFLYDVAVSYASEQEEYVGRVVKILEAEKLKVFYAPGRKPEYKARDMFARFYEIYRYQCRYAACFLSREYRNKEYTMHEFKTALLRNKKEKRNCIIPVYFDQKFMEGLDRDISYLEADKLCEVEVADQIAEIVRAGTAHHI